MLGELTGEQQAHGGLDLAGGDGGLLVVVGQAGGLAGAAPLPHAQGASLAAAFAGLDLPRNRPLFFSWLTQGAAGVRHGPWKYLRADHGHELFDLASDPGENLPRLRKRSARAVDQALIGEHRASSERLRASFGGASATQAPSSGSDAPVDPRMHESLRALGYVQ